MYALGTFARAGESPFPGLVVEESRVIDLSGYGWPGIEQLLRSWGRAQGVLDNIVAHGRAGTPLSDLHVHAPLSPGQVFRRQAPAPEGDDESMSESALTLQTRPTLRGPYDQIVLPPGGTRRDLRPGMALVIGLGGRHIAERDALAHIAGYMIASDLDTGDALDHGASGSDRVVGASRPQAHRSLSLGPWMVPAKFVHDNHRFRVMLSLSGQVVRNVTTTAANSEAATLVSRASSLVTLHPGDLILTSCGGRELTQYPGFLSPGDEIQTSITGLGFQHRVCVTGAQLAVTH
jgi:2-keto-4-pentenoate hydratase/2-oxohepta-3-ene-1,7-dioic acid hydratase in catechol pathway